MFDEAALQELPQHSLDHRTQGSMLLYKPRGPDAELLLKPHQGTPAVRVHLDRGRRDGRDAVPPHPRDRVSLHRLNHKGLVEAVNLGDAERGLTLTREGRDVLGSHSMDRDDEPSQAFYAGASRERELDHDSNLTRRTGRKTPGSATSTTGSRFGGSSSNGT